MKNSANLNVVAMAKDFAKLKTEEDKLAIIRQLIEQIINQKIKRKDSYENQNSEEYIRFKKVEERIKRLVELFFLN